MWTYVTLIVTLIVALPLVDDFFGVSDLLCGSSTLRALLQEWWPVLIAISSYSTMWLVTRHWPEVKVTEEEPAGSEVTEDGTAPTPPKHCEKSTRAPSPPTDDDSAQYPDGYVFASNYVNSADDLERLRRETTQMAMRELFRSEDWRAHLRERGREESAYNWQRRQSLSSSDSRPCH